MPEVSPEVLRWARETAGLALAEAASRLDLGASRGVSAVERLRALEAGAAEPSRPLLKRMAKQYRRPLLAFYLPSPPRTGRRGDDFRTLPADRPPQEEAWVDALLRDVRARQSLVRAALEEEEAPRLSYVGSLSQGDAIDFVILSLRRELALDLRDFRSAPDTLEAFAVIREKAERAGVFVLLLGNLGSHHTAISLEGFRGFALSDSLAPFIVINDQDSHAAWSFTLIHELVHIGLGQTAISGRGSELALEKFCDEVASGFLLPEEELRGFHRGEPATLAGRVTAFARQRNLSSSMVAVRLFQNGTLHESDLAGLMATFRDRWLASRERRRRAARESKGGPDYYVVRSHRLGDALVGLVSRATKGGLLTTSKAAKVLGVKAKQVQLLLEARVQHGPSL